MFTKINTLSQNLARAIVVSSDLSEPVKLKLKEFDIDIIPSYVNKNVNRYLSRHVDMQLVHISDNTYLCEPSCYDYYKQHLEKYSINLLYGDTNLSSNYPGDIAYNIIITEDFAVHNFKYTDSKLKSFLNGKSLIDVSQGYAGCSVCKIESKAFITADAGIAKAMSQFDCEVLQISAGNIILEGFDTGFIGGACFMISNSILVVNGNLYAHPDAEIIEQFCESHGVKVIHFPDVPLTDIGSAVAIGL